MFMVVILHVLGQGGVLSTVKYNSLNYYVAWFLEVGAYCAVDVFALTTGYLMVGRKWKLSRIIDLWLQVVFYSLTITVLFAIFKSEAVTGKAWLKAILPVSFNTWWYFSAYFGLFFLIPFINKLIDALNKKQAIILTAIILILFAFSDFIRQDVFGLDAGYSTLWLVCLYIIGAFIKKYDFCANVNKWWLFLIYFASILVSIIRIPDVDFILRLVLGREFEGSLLFVRYTSPLVILMAVSLLLFFSRIKFCKPINGIVKFLSPLSFAVYLIHEHGLVVEYIIIGAFSQLATKNVFILAGGVLGSAIAIFTTCIFIEWLRTLLFKVTKINKLTKALGEKIDKKINFDD